MEFLNFRLLLYTVAVEAARPEPVTARAANFCSEETMAISLVAVGSFFANPNRLLLLPGFENACIAFAIFWPFLSLWGFLAYGQSINCDSATAPPIQLAYLAGLLFFVYGEMAFISRHLFTKNQTFDDKNRTKLGRCNLAFCSAHRLRIVKINLSIDMILGFMLIYTVSMWALFFRDCIQEAMCAVPCFAQRWLPAMPIYLFSFFGTVLKNTIACSEFDYTIESCELEDKMDSRSDSTTWFNKVLRWSIHIERRISRSWPLISLLSVINLIFMVIGFSIPGYDPVVSAAAGISYTISTCLIIVTDGSFILLPLTLWTNRTQLRSIYHNPLRLRFIPKKKAQIIILSFVIIFSLVGTWLACKLSTKGNVVWKVTFGFLIVDFILVIFIVLVEDMQASFDDLIKLDVPATFGLVSSRRHFVRRLSEIFNKSKKGAEDQMHFEFDVPTFFASQSRIELSVVISYTWFGEDYYNSRAPKFLTLKNSKLKGTAPVKLSLLQIEKLILALSNSSEDYVWMDQFCIPQPGPHGGFQGLGPENQQKVREIRKSLIKQMTGLYSSAAVVVALDNEHEPGLRESRLYQNRLWCVQEYCFPKHLNVFYDFEAAEQQQRRGNFSFLCGKLPGRIAPLSQDTLRVLRYRRKQVKNRWFQCEPFGTIIDGQVICQSLEDHLHAAQNRPPESPRWPLERNFTDLVMGRHMAVVQVLSRGSVQAAHWQQTPSSLSRTPDAERDLDISADDATATSRAGRSHHSIDSSDCPLELDDSEQHHRTAALTHGGLPIIVDYLFAEPGNRDSPSMTDDFSSELETLIQERVCKIGALSYTQLVREISASDPSDAFPALAQAWFGIIMTRDETAWLLAQAILDDLLRQERSESVVVIDNTMTEVEMSAAGGAGWYRVPASMMVDRMFSCGPPLRPQSPYLVTVGPNGHPLPLDSDGSPERQRIACMRCCRIQIALDPWGTKAYLCEGELISIEERPPVERWSVPRVAGKTTRLIFVFEEQEKGEAWSAIAAGAILEGLSPAHIEPALVFLLRMEVKCE